MIRVEVKPALLQWAIERAGDRAGAVRKRFPHLAEWQQGEEPRTFVGSARLISSPESVADDMRRRLGFSIEERRHCATWTDALRLFIQQAEATGVLVMVSGVVGSNNRRTLDPDEFRGFALQCQGVTVPGGHARGSDFVLGFSTGMKNQKQSLTPRLRKQSLTPRLRETTSVVGGILTINRHPLRMAEEKVGTLRVVMPSAQITIRREGRRREGTSDFPLFSFDFL